MTKARLVLWVVLTIVLLIFSTAPASAVIIITNNTWLPGYDDSLDGQDLVVSNCTLTVEGTRAFNSLQLLSGAVLNHTVPSGSTSTNYVFTTTDEPHVLGSASPIDLGTGVNTTTVVVKDVTASITYTQQVDYVVVAIGGGHQIQIATNSAIPDGATVLVSYTRTLNYSIGVFLTITNDLHIHSGAAINVNGLGINRGVADSGTGQSMSTNFPYTYTAGSGGGLGGYGGKSSTFAIGGGSSSGVFLNPNDLGNAGGNAAGGSSGGGRVALSVGGELRIDGHITANGMSGTNAHSGGGSGGSLWFRAQTFSGSGFVAANGGNGEVPNGGGGGGGRIAISFSTNQFTGTIQAHGGAGFEHGGAGMIYLRDTNNLAGSLLIINNGTLGARTVVSSVALTNYTVSNGAIVHDAIMTTSNLFIGANSKITARLSSIQYTINGNAIIESNVVIDVDSIMSSSGLGLGQFFSCSPNSVGSGGSHGGQGGGTICGSPIFLNIYGSPTNGTTGGSRGGSSGDTLGGAGGGVVRFTVSGTLLLDGTISANGGSSTNGRSGGGSGGGVHLTVGKIAGNGTISANGGDSSPFFGGGGGGGRVAVYFDTNEFTGRITAYGGIGYTNGGAGTIYLKDNNQPLGSLIIQNRGTPGAVTSIGVVPPLNLSVAGGAFLLHSSFLVLGNFLIGSNSWLSGTLSGTSFTATNVVIHNQGGIIFDGTGQDTGGAGGTSGGAGTGAGHGGFGGYSATAPTSTTGSAYGSITSPARAGSAGGAGSGTPNTGGAGGGIVNLTVYDTFVLDGKISANGVLGAGVNSGGGSGGGISIKAGILSGSGSVSANGGPANGTLGGGGAGGRIGLFLGTNNFTGSLQAHGGTGFSSGGAGTIYVVQASNGIPVGIPSLIVDNAGTIGRHTVISTPTNFSELKIDGGAVVSLSMANLLLENFYLGTNSTVSAGSITITVLANAAMDTGAKLTLTGVSANSTGTGSASSSSNLGGGGAGHGGYGGASRSNYMGGNIYGSAQMPTSTGSRGGNAATVTNNSGYGGGYVQMQVSGMLQLDGMIAAEGTEGIQGAGGGSGGSVWLRAADFSGSGTVSVNGGAGNAPTGGGGGGGRIAIWADTNRFVGQLSARGGGGATAGGPGTIYTTLDFNGAKTGHLLIDSGGIQGTNTLLPSITNMHLTITGNTSVASSNATFVALGDLLITSGSTLLAPALTITASNAIVESGASILANGFGDETIGAGVSGTTNGSGAGHGGFGGSSRTGALGGNSYGTIPSPATQGSSGGNSSVTNRAGKGGASLRMQVYGNLHVDGLVSANGMAGSSIGGGGSGGSIWISSGNVSGSGTISAEGGAGGNSSSGGGGGGRIAIWYNTNQFTGSISARGGTGATPGGAGTIYQVPSFDGTGIGSIILDNGGLRGTNTSSSGISNGRNLTVGRGAILSLTSGAFNSLTVSSNGSIYLNSSPVTISTTNDLVIEKGGVLSSDGFGFGPSGSGTAASGGGGGGNGGYGSNGTQTNAIGRSTLGSIPTANSAGTGGGPNDSNSRGGGAMRLAVGGNLTVDGKLSSNGTNGIVYGGGGSAGGSIYITTKNISGSGTISTDGGNGEPFGGGGGGGGGRIAIYFDTNEFTGTLSAQGGQGPLMFGGAGTIYLKTNSHARGHLFVDNAGWLGTNTPLNGLPPDSLLTIGGGAAVNPTNPVTLHHLLIQPGGIFNILGNAPTSKMNLTVLTDLQVQENGTISADHTGYGLSSGSGPGQLDHAGKGSGGGHGGVGGASLYGASGGVIYGAADEPTDFGSPGGMSPTLAGFSRGGGVIRLKVGGTLTADGNISSDGENGFIEGSGGGSGGSVWITARNFTGSGAITARGGDGEPIAGGGGGGGRIAIYARTNSFAGGYSVIGGFGAESGGTGTVYLTDELPAFQVVEQSPTGEVGYALNSIGLTFSSPFDATSLLPFLTINSPTGAVAASSAAGTIGGSSVSIALPPQTKLGEYQVQIAPGLQDMFGAEMTEPYTGSFTIIPLLISGVVTDTNGSPVTGVALQPSGGLSPVFTDADGMYVVPVEPLWSGSVTPTNGNFIFVPPSRSYVSLNSWPENQNFLMALPESFNLNQAETQGTNIVFDWFGINGLTYQPEYSTNLVNWLSYGPPIIGTNGLVHLVLPTSAEEQKFFRLKISK